MDDIINSFIFGELLPIVLALPYGKIALALSLVLVLDHSIRHIGERLHEWKDKWYCKAAVVILTLGLLCHTFVLCGEFM